MKLKQIRAYQEEYVEANKPSQTFISYSRVNQQFAIKLACELKSAGFSVWLDQFDIPTGARWDDEIEKALEGCEIFLFIMTPASIGSENAKDEVGYAIDHGKHILPVLLEECSVPLRLRRLQYVDFTQKSFNEGIKSAKELLGRFVHDIESSKRGKKRAAGGSSSHSETSTATSESKTMPKRSSPSTIPAKGKHLPGWIVVGGGAVAVVVLVAAGFFLRPLVFGPPQSTPSQTPSVPSPEPPPTLTNMPEPTVISFTPTPPPLRSFTEEFDADSSWFQDWTLQLRHSDSKKEANFNPKIENGELVVEENYEKVWGYFLYDPLVVYDNVEMEVVVSGLRSTATLGLVCQYGSDQGWYEFDVNGGGEYAVHYVEGMSSGLDEDRFLIKNGFIRDFKYSVERTSENIIWIQCDGKNLSLHVNGVVLMDQVPSKFDPQQGQVGIAIRSADNYPITVVVQSVKVTEP